MRHLRRSLTLRLLLLALIWLAAALGVGGYVLSIAFRDYVISDFDARLGRILDHMVGASVIEDGILRFTRPVADQRFSEPYSGWYWQVDAEDEPPFRSRSLWDQALAPDLPGRGLGGTVTETDGPEGQRLRVMARDVVLPDSDRTFRYMVAGDTAQIRTDIRAFDRLIAFALGVLGAGLLLAIILQIWIGLMPLKAVRRGVAAIRSGRARRLEGTFPTEIAPLVDEINALIEANEQVVERARTHVGNLAHALKTPLTVLRNEAAREKSALAETVRIQTDLIRRHVDHHLKRARASGGGGRVGAAVVLQRPVAELVRAMDKIYAGRGLAITAHIPPDIAVRVEEQDLAEMIGNLLDNACKWARNEVRIGVRRIREAGRNWAEVRIVDDGPGVSDAEVEALFERGRRLDETKPGSGLGLAIVRDVAEFNGGEVRLEKAEGGGLAAILILPLAE
ncbi:MAG: sensor histidine kinase [Rhodothalassiaceae bacterium]